MTYSSKVNARIPCVIERSERLRFLVEQDAFAVCPRLPILDFIEFCKKRGVETSVDQLERFEKLGLLFPVGRMKRPWVTHKVEFFDEGRQYRDHGLLQDGETWVGDTRSEWGSWRIRNVADELELIDEGHLWDPRLKDFSPWAAYRDEHGTHTETYYSMFQLYPLEWKQMWLDARVDMSLFADGATAETISRQMADGITHRVEPLRDPMPQDDSAFLSQLISTRYYPLTQTDRRTFTLREPRFGWDWYEYIRRWDAKAVAEKTGMNDKQLRDWQQTVAMMARDRDPMEQWYQLVRFISVDKKSKLKGKAQYAQLLYSMESMLRMFAKDAFALDLHPPDEGRSWKNEDLYGKGIPDDPHRHLEFVVNDYHLNPRPKLILVVEGPSEEAVLPRLAAEVLGHEFSPLGIEVRALGGVGEYTGKKRLEKLGALAKFIDEYHFRQTVVIVVLDREGRVEAVTKNLLEATSKLYPKRMLTKPEYLRIWRRSIEFDNFTHDEIAEVLSALANAPGTFAPPEIAAAQDAYDRKEADPLSALFLRKVGRDLDKIACLNALADRLAHSVETERLDTEMQRRPILKILDEAIRLAALNHQPVTVDTWTMNQESGYFGQLIPAKP